MANWYVFSGATGTGAGTSWSNAMVRLAFAISSSAAGDQLFVASNHSEAQASPMTLSFRGTISNPNLVISVNQGGSVPPVGADYQPGAIIGTTGANNFEIDNSLYMAGFTINCGVGGTATTIILQGNNAADSQWFKDCLLAMPSNSANNSIRPYFGGDVRLVWENVAVQFGNAGNDIRFAGASGHGGSFEWMKTVTAISGGTAPTTLFNNANGAGTVQAFIHGVDLSALGAGNSLVDISNQPPSFVFADCKLGLGVSATVNAQTYPQGYVNLINCDSSGTGYRSEWHNYFGDITTDTSTTMVSGASDGVQTISHRYSGNSQTNVYSPLVGPRLSTWVASSGNHTATIQVTSTSSLSNRDIWAVFEFLNTPSAPISSFITTGLPNALSTATALSASSVTWNNGQGQNQFIQGSFSTAMAGVVYATIYCSKRSQVWVNPVVAMT